jgi:hypothetical protein
MQLARYRFCKFSVTACIYWIFRQTGFWHGHCNHQLMSATHQPGVDMDLIQQKFASVFSAYQVNTQARPDGGVLLTLRAADGKVTRRVLTYGQLHSAEQLSWAISAIRRDLAEEASELPVISMLQSQQRFALPTYR